MAAGVPLVEMAGGIVSNYPSGDFDLNTAEFWLVIQRYKMSSQMNLQKLDH